MQYLKEDDKWVLSLAKYLTEKGYLSLINRKYNEALENYSDAINLNEIQRDKYIQIKDKNLLKKCGDFIQNCRISISCALSCSIIKLMPEIDIHEYNIKLLSEWKKTGLPSLDDDESIIAFLESIRFFPHKINLNNYMNLINKFNITNKKHWSNIVYFLNARKKLLRKKIFEKWSTKPILVRDNLAELIECQTYLSKYFDKLNKENDAINELADKYRYKAFLADDIARAEHFFNKSISLFEILTDNNPDDENYKRDLLFAKARKSEYLAFRHNDLSSRIQYLKSANGYYGRLNDSRAYLARFLFSYYQMKKYIVEDDKFQLGVEVARRIEDDKNKIKISISKYPDVQRLYFICTLIEHFPIKTPKGAEIKKINDIQYYITIGLEHIKPLWEIVYAYSLVMRSVGDNKDLNKFFRESVSLFLQSGSTREIEKVAGRLFFSEPTEKVSQEFIEYLRRDEGQNLEFKASFSIDVRGSLFSGKTIFLNELEEEFLKAIVGFLNSSGGSLILGVLEKRKDLLQFKDKLDEKFNKYIYGVEREYKHDGYDGYIRRIEDILRERIDSNLLSRLEIDKHSLSGHDLIHFIIPRADKWYYLNNEIFFVREHNQTINKKGADADEYKSQNPR
jgi:hypothetical protein